MGRRRTSRCRCGNLLIFDGRTLSGSELAADLAQPLEPTLTPSEAHAEAVAGRAAPPAFGDPTGGDPTAGAPTERLAAELSRRDSQDSTERDSQGSTEEASVESQSIGRIRLRKAEPPSTEPAVEQQRPHAPDTRVDPSTPELPDSPRSLSEALDTLDLDRLAERIRPTWEVPASRRVTPPGDDPEVVMHYPAEWQPPPSERRRMRASWEVTPTLPLSLPPQTADKLEGDWEIAAREFASTSAPLSPPAPDTGAALTGAPLPVRDEAPRDPLVAEAGSPSAGASARNNDAAPAAHRRVATPPGSGLESTAPTAVSDLPTAARRPSGAKLWVAGLAAAALVALVWRATSAPHATPLATTTTVPTPAQVGEVLGAAEGAPPNEPNPPPRAASPSAAPASTTDGPSVAPAEDTLAPAPAPAVAPVAPSIHTPPPAPAPTVAPVARSIHTPPPAPAPAAARRSSASRRGWPETREQPPTSEPSSSDSRGSVSPSEPSGAEPTGPDPAEVTQALGVAAARARACSASDASGAGGSVRVLLNPEGGVLNATALGDFQGTTAGACVENAFRSARTPAYDGRTLSTVYPFSLIVD